MYVGGVNNNISMQLYLEAIPSTHIITYNQTKHNILYFNIMEFTNLMLPIRLEMLFSMLLGEEEDVWNVYT